MRPGICAVVLLIYVFVPACDEGGSSNGGDDGGW